MKTSGDRCKGARTCREAVHQGMILVFGRSGQVAEELARLEPGALFLSRNEADLSDPKACAAAIIAHRPEAVINAAAYTAVDRAEEEESLARLVNGEAPGAIACACAEFGIPIVHISTDYVFDGSGSEPFAPNAPTGPLGAYGRTKLAGEIAVRESGAVHAILRTSWVFSDIGRNFVKTMLFLGKRRNSLNVVADQVGGPTPAHAVAHASLVMARTLVKDPGLSGTYHIAGTPNVSWADFAREIFAQAGLTVEVCDIPTSDYSSLAPRPVNSRLDSSGLSQFGLEAPNWKVALSATLAKLEGPTHA